MKKIALCGIARLENNYIREWVEYHKSIGIDNIFIYDNNDEDEEHFEDVIADYINSGYVKLIDARGRNNYQVEAYDDCYKNYGKDFDWMLFLDIDEFFILNNCYNNDIKSFLDDKEDEYAGYNDILFKWKYCDDNGYVTVTNNNYSVLTRFTHMPDNCIEDYLSKQMVRTKVPDLRVNAVHQLKQNTSPVETFVQMYNPQEVLTLHDGTGYCVHVEDVLKTPAYIKHFRYKTIQEYLDNKCARGYPMPYKNSGMDLGIVEFFEANDITEEKIEFIKTWINLHPEITPRKKLILENQLEKVYKMAEKRKKNSRKG